MKRWYAYVAGGVALGVVTIALVVTSGGDSSSRRADASGPVGIRDRPVVARAGKPYHPRRPPAVSDALREAVGIGNGSLGHLFDGLTFGENMPPSVQARIDDWQQHYGSVTGSVIRYRPNLDTGFPMLDIVFTDRAAAREALETIWGRPDLDWGAWSNPDDHMLAALYDDGTQAGLVFTPYATIDELVDPDEPVRLGFEPIPLVGASRDDVERALTLGLERIDATTYRWRPRGLGAGLDVTLVARGGMIWSLGTEIDVHTTSQRDKLVAALTRKYGEGYHKGDQYTWRPADVLVDATARGTGQLSIVVEMRESLKTR